MTVTGRFPSAFLDEIRSRVALSTLIGRRVTWDRKKTNPRKGDFWARCPAHAEKTPSFHADDRRGAYKCFGCGIGGDHFQWMTDFERLSFPEAVAELASLAGLQLPESTPETRAAAAKKLTLIEANEQAAIFFAAELQKTPEAMAYVKARAITSDEVERFRIGYAPNGNGVLKAFGAQASLVEAGLVALGDDGHPYDRFRHRLTFPIADERGRVIAFSGRTLSPDEKAKYLNSPETAIFIKGKVLYNAQEAKDRAWNDQPLVVVEGHIDVIAASRAGVGACAAMGTALTADHVRLLWKMSAEPILCFDGDEAGHRAADKALDLLIPEVSAGFSVRFARLPAKTDPDQFVRSRGAAAFQKLLAAAIPLADALWERETANGVIATPEHRAAIEDSLRETIQKIRDGGTRRQYGRDFRDRLFALGRRPGVYRSNGSSHHSTSPSAGRLLYGFHRAATLTLREAILVGAIADAPQAALQMVEEMAADNRLSEEAHVLVSRLVEAILAAPPGTLEEAIEAAGLTEAVDDALAAAAAAGIVMHVGASDREAIGIIQTAYRQEAPRHEPDVG